MACDSPEVLFGLGFGAKGTRKVQGGKLMAVKTACCPGFGLSFDGVTVRNSNWLWRNRIICKHSLGTIFKTAQSRCIEFQGSRVEVYMIETEV